MLIKICVLICAVSTFTTAALTLWTFVESRKYQDDYEKSRDALNQFTNDTLKKIIKEPEKKVDFVPPTR